MAGVVELPGLPPASPYEAYLYVLVIPFAMRLVMVLPPLIDLWNSYASEARFFISRLWKLPIKGLFALGLNEVLALCLPVVLAFYARTIFNPLGWPDWASVPRGGEAALLVTAGIWIFIDFLRVGRTRRLLIQATKQDVGMAKLALDAAVKTRTTLEKLRRFSPLNWHSDVRQADDVMSSGEVEKPAKRGLFGTILGAGADVGTAVKDGGLEVADAAASAVRRGAGALADRIDSEIHKGIAHHAKWSLILLMRDFVISLMPILALVALHAIW